MPRLIKNLLFSLLVTITVFTVVELVLHLMMGPIEPDVYVHSYVGEPKEWLMETGSLVRPMYKHQPQSFPIERTQPRVAFLGGSTVHGGSPTVGFHQEFPALVGKALGVKAWNLARPSIDSHDIRKIVEELKDYDFDAWVIYTGHNDFGNTYFFARFQEWGARETIGLHAFFQHFRLYRLMVQVNKSRGNGRKKGLGMSDFRGPTVSMEQKTAAQELYLKNVERIIWEAQSADIPLLFVVPTSSWIRSPLGGCTKGQVCAQDTHKQGLQFRASNSEKAYQLLSQTCTEDSIPLRMIPEAQDRLRSLLREKDVAFVDPHLSFPRESGLDLPSEKMFFDHVHLSREGHQELANQLVPVLQELIQK